MQILNIVLCGFTSWAVTLNNKSVAWSKGLIWNHAALGWFGVYRLCRADVGWVEVQKPCVSQGWQCIFSHVQPSQTWFPRVALDAGDRMTCPVHSDMNQSSLSIIPRWEVGFSLGWMNQILWKGQELSLLAVAPAAPGLQMELACRFLQMRKEKIWQHTEVKPVSLPPSEA